MYLNQVNNYSYSPNFNGTARIRTKDGATAVLNVLRNTAGDIYEISGNIMKKGKSIGQVNYHNEKGFSNSRLGQIVKSLAKKSKYPEENAEYIVNKKIMNASWEKGDRFIGDF